MLECRTCASDSGGEPMPGEGAQTGGVTSKACVLAVFEQHKCHRIATQEWAGRQRQHREQLRAASAQMQQIILEAQ
eukprot:4138697-Pyramimonas_sp.AAC.1